MGLEGRGAVRGPFARWRTLDTEHFSVHFAEHTRARARIVAEVAESVYPRVTGWLKWAPESRTQIVVLDSLDFSNGYASPYPFNFIGIVLSPPTKASCCKTASGWSSCSRTSSPISFTSTRRAVRRSSCGAFSAAISCCRSLRAALSERISESAGTQLADRGLAVYSESDWTRGTGGSGKAISRG